MQLVAHFLRFDMSVSFCLLSCARSYNQRMCIESESSQATPAGGNVFADLGFEPSGAEPLHVESQHILEISPSDDDITPN